MVIIPPPRSLINHLTPSLESYSNSGYVFLLWRTKESILGLSSIHTGTQPLLQGDRFLHVTVFLTNQMHPHKNRKSTTVERRLRPTLMSAEMVERFWLFFVFRSKSQLMDAYFGQTRSSESARAFSYRSLNDFASQNRTKVWTIWLVRISLRQDIVKHV